MPSERHRGSTVNTQVAADVAPLFTDFTATILSPQNWLFRTMREHAGPVGYTANPLGFAFVDLGLGPF